MKGIYQYTDLKSGAIVYIGKDSHIDENRRHKQHITTSTYSRQAINKVLQNNPDRYEYSILYCSNNISDDNLNMLEMSFIERFNPKFNFTNGGEGTTGYKHTNEAKRKMSESRKGKKHWNYGKTTSDETKKKMSESLLKKNARIIKHGKKYGKQIYAVRSNGKYLKHSFSKDKLIKWFKENYPNEKLEVI